MQHLDLLLQHSHEIFTTYLWNIWNTLNIDLQHAFSLFFHTTHRRAGDGRFWLASGWGWWTLAEGRSRWLSWWWAGGGPSVGAAEDGGQRPQKRGRRQGRRTGLPRMEDDGHEVWAEARKTSTVESDVEDELGGVWCDGRDGRTGHPIFF
jgi:hypothetical protein